MLWRNPIAAQRLTPRGEVAMTCAGEPGFSENNLDLGRWRS
jgi:hypothetical protein